MSNTPSTCARCKGQLAPGDQVVNVRVVSRLHADGTLATDRGDAVAHLAPCEPAEAWEYGFYDSHVGPDPIWWYTFGGLVGFDSVESAQHTASKSVYGEAVIVRRRPGSTDWEIVP